MSVFETAKKYYPKLWGIDRLKALVKVGKLTAEEFEDITGERLEAGNEATNETENEVVNE